MRRPSGSSTVAVDLFYTAFAVMFVLEATTKHVIPTEAPSYNATLIIEMPDGEEPTESAPEVTCLAYFEVGSSDANSINNFEGVPRASYDKENRTCVFDLGDVAISGGNASFFARTMLIRFPEERAEAKIRVGSRVVELEIDNRLSECAPCK